MGSRTHFPASLRFSLSSPFSFFLFSFTLLLSFYSVFLSSTLSLHQRCNAASDLTISSYVPPILYPENTFQLPLPPKSSARAILTVRRTLKSHKALRRIFHAAISAGHDERRYPSWPAPRTRPKEIGRSRSNGGSDEISSWPFIKCRDTGEGEENGEKRSRNPSIRGETVATCENGK